jgi:hypothetical protein
LIVQNATSPQADFGYWESVEQAIRFREALSPIVIRMEFRLAELENPARQHGIRLGQVATRQLGRNRWTISLLGWKSRSGPFGCLSLPLLL